MPPFAAMLLSLVMQVAGPLQSHPVAPDPSTPPDATEAPRRTLALIDTRLAWRRVWAAAHWDRTAAPVREMGDRITREVFPLLTDPDDDVRRLAQWVLAEVSSPTLGALLRTQPVPDARLATEYLARNDDDALAAFLTQAPTPGMPPGSAFTQPMMEGWLVLGRLSRRVAGPRIVTALAQVTGYDRERSCEAAVWLPRAARDAAADALLGAMRDPADEPGPSCAILWLGSRNGRARLLSALQWQTANPAAATASVASWRPFAVLGLLASEHAAATRALIDRVLPTDGWARERPWIFQSLDDGLVRFAAALPLASPATRPMLDRLTSTFTASPGTVLVRYASRDVPALESMLARWTTLDIETTAAVVNALTLLARTPAQITSLRATLDRIANDTAAGRGDDPSSRVARRWIVEDARRALDATTTCAAQRGCLVALATHADDTTAARAIVLAGPSAFASIRDEDAHDLAARMLAQPTGWLSVAFYSTIPGCPRALRVLRESTGAHYGRDVRALAASYASAFRRRCEEAQ